MPRTQPTPRSRRHFPRPHAHLPHRLPGTLRDNAVQAPRQRRHDTLTTPSRHPHGGVVTNRPARPSHSAALTYEKAPPRLSFTHIAAFLFACSGFPFRIPQFPIPPSPVLASPHSLSPHPTPPPPAPSRPASSSPSTAPSARPAAGREKKYAKVVACLILFINFVF